MKLTRRQLKAMILEVLTGHVDTMPTQQVEKLKVLDFDDTIADTSEQVKLYTDHGQSHRMVSSDEFAVYEPVEGEYYDDSSFSQFDDVDLNTAIPIQPVVEILKNFVNAPGSRKILILTARKQIAEPGIRRFLQSIGIDDTNIDVVGVASKDPAAKVQVIDHYLNNVLQGVNFVSFFDDSGPNAATVKEYLDSLGIQNDVAQVIQGDDKSQKKLLRLREAFRRL